MIYFQWIITPEDPWAQLAQQQVDAIEADLVRLIDELTDEVAGWMRANARWQDRTGDARAGLWADVEHVTRQTVYLLMSHDVTLNYTWFLEYAHRGRFAILADAADHFWPVLWRGAQRIVRNHSS